jgi:hypothetical protein
MLDAEGPIRDQINRGLDCTETSVRLMAMRREMLSLIGQRNALGGRETCPNIAGRLRENYRTPAPRVLGKRISADNVARWPSENSSHFMDLKALQ